MTYQSKQLDIQRLQGNFTLHHDLVMRLIKLQFMKMLEISSLEQIQGGGDCLNPCNVVGGLLSTLGCLGASVVIGISVSTGGCGCGGTSLGIVVGVHI